MLFLLAVRLVLTGLPGVAAALFAARCGLRQVPVLLAIALAGSGVVAMLAGRRHRGRNPSEWRFALLCFATVLLGCLVWGLVLFGNEPARTVIHVGSLAMPILAICGCVVGLRAVLPRFAVYYVVVASLLSLAIYVPALTPAPGSSWSPSALILAAAALAAFAAAALRASGSFGMPNRLVR